MNFFGQPNTIVIILCKYYYDSDHNNKHFLWARHSTRSRAGIYTLILYSSLIREVLVSPHFTDGETKAQPAAGPITRSRRGHSQRKRQQPPWFYHSPLGGACPGSMASSSPGDVLCIQTGSRSLEGFRLSWSSWPSWSSSTTWVLGLR